MHWGSIILQHHYLNGVFSAALLLSITPRPFPFSFGMHSSCVWLCDWFVSYIILDKASCLFDWIVTERESPKFTLLVSAKLAAAAGESQPPVLPFSPDHVFLVQIFFPPPYKPCPCLFAY